MAAGSAKSAFLSLADSGDVARDLSTYLNKDGLQRSADSIDTTTFGATSKDYVPGLKDGKITLEGQWDSTVDGYLEGILGVEDQAFVYGPAGSTAGLVKYSGVGILTTYNIDTSVADSIKFTADYQVSGNVTRGTFT